MEIWQILLICIMLLPAFFALNYLVVKIAVRRRRELELRMEMAAAASIRTNPKGLKRHRLRK